MKKRAMDFLILAVLTGSLAACKRNGAESFERSLEKKIPIGTSADQVDKILTEAKVEHSYFAKDKTFYAIIRDPSKPDQALRDSSTLIISLDDKKKVKEIKFNEGPANP